LLFSSLNVSHDDENEVDQEFRAVSVLELYRRNIEHQAVLERLSLEKHTKTKFNVINIDDESSQ
jgi:hypothetical protein